MQPQPLCAITRARFPWLVVLALVVALTGTGCSISGGTTEPAQEPAEPSGEEPSLEFVGPNGEVPGLLEELELTEEEVAEVRGGEYTAAFVWHGAGDFVTAVENGARAEFENLGIDVVASTQADFDAATQGNNVESVLALDPDVIVAIAVDPTSAEATFRPIVDAGVRLVVMTTPPANYTAGEEFVSIVTENLAEAGRINAEILGNALGGEGKVAHIYYDADFWFTNQRDDAFKDWMAHLYPDVEIVAEEGFADPANTQEIASAVIARHPDVTGIYVSWATGPAEGVLAALRGAGRSDVKVVTNDLDATIAADMMRDGNVVGLVGNGATGIGKGLAVSAAYGMLDKPAPELVASVPIAVTKDNLMEAWVADYGDEPPANVTGG